jgi:DNA-binding transcriptional ArsR family regulator
MGNLLKNPHRKKILEILASRKIATPKEISDELGIGVTTVYYHLDLMKGLVNKTGRGEYSLTEKGLAVYKEGLQDSISTNTPVGRIMPYLIFAKQVSSPKRFLPLSIAIGIAEFLVCYTQYFRPYLLGYSRSIDTSSLPLYYLGNLLLLFCILEAFSYVLTRRTGGEISLLNGIMVSRIPLMLSLIVPIIGITSSGISIATLALAQLASIALLSLYVSLSKGIRQEITVIICLVILYFNLLFFAT